MRESRFALCWFMRRKCIGGCDEELLEIRRRDFLPIVDLVERCRVADPEGHAVIIAALPSAAAIAITDEPVFRHAGYLSRPARFCLSGVIPDFLDFFGDFGRQIP